MTKIFVVVGETGEYSHRSEWLVCAYEKEEDALQHVTKASEYADAWFQVNQRHRMDRSWQDGSNPMDPKFSCDYTGTKYYCSEVELHDKFTTPEVTQ